MNHLHALQRYGQSYWLDGPSAAMLRDGRLVRWIKRQGLAGVTLDPAMLCGTAPDGDCGLPERVRVLATGGAPVDQLYDDFMIAQARSACDQFRPLYESSSRTDGHVSLGLAPRLAHDSEASLAQALRYWRDVARPNLLIRLPATASGIKVMEELLFRGISVHATLLFGLQAYWDVFQAYARALEMRLTQNRPLAEVTSMAGFFLGPIDSAVDRRLLRRIPDLGPVQVSEARALSGRSAVANARLAYASLQALFSSERWQRLESRGAHRQRLMWSATEPDEAYPRLSYVEALIGPDTLSAMSADTADGFDAAGEAKLTLDGRLADAHAVMDGLRRLGIDFPGLDAELREAGLRGLIEAHQRTLAVLAEQIRGSGQGDREQLLAAMANRLRREVIRTTTLAGSGCPSSAMSCAEIVATLFFHVMRWDPDDPAARDVDCFILSKSHAQPVLLAALRLAGMPAEQASAPGECRAGIRSLAQVASGSPGQGLAIANGMALADRMQGIPASVHCLMGDGECAAGAVWEAAQFTAWQGLSSVVAIVDLNGLQQGGSSPYGQDSAALAARFRAFGWDTREVDGHDVGALLRVLQRPADSRPVAVLARTLKGRGVSFVEGRDDWHGRVLDRRQSEQALIELDGPEQDIPVVRCHLGDPGPAFAEADGQHSGISYRRGQHIATRAAFGETLLGLGAVLPQLVVLDGDVMNQTGTDGFSRAFPQRIIEAHPAEQNMVGVALGLAASGWMPVVCTCSAFLARAHDVIRLAAHARPPHLVICGSRAGARLGGHDVSQPGPGDFAMFRAIDGCSILYPSDAQSSARLTELAVRTDGMVYLCTTCDATPVIYADDEEFVIGGSKTLVASAHDRLTLVAAGATVAVALQAQGQLARNGIAARVIDVYSVAPLDIMNLQRAARETGTLLVVEDHQLHGGLGDAVSSQVGRLARVFRMGVGSSTHHSPGSAPFSHQPVSVDRIVREAHAVAA